VAKGIRCDVYKDVHHLALDRKQREEWGQPPRDPYHEPDSIHVTDRVTQVTLCGPGIPEQHEATDDAPEFRLHTLGGNFRPAGVDLLRAGPPKPGMASGNFIFASYEKGFPSPYPIMCLDRYEKPID